MDTIQEAKSNLLDSVLWFEQLESSIIKSADAASKLIQRCKTLIKQIEKMVYDMDFKVLYDEKKELFSIGYNREEEQLTNSYYDLFASEARHTSFIAIARATYHKNTGLSGASPYNGRKYGVPCIMERHNV